VLMIDAMRCAVLLAACCLLLVLFERFSLV
jgi:hypothetical protein